MYWIKKYFSAPLNHWRSAYEVFVTTAFSLAPFLVVYFVHAAQKDAVDSGSALGDLFGRGQIFILSYGVFGTIFWLAFIRPDRPRHEARVTLGLFATLAILPVIGFIGVDPTFSTIINYTVMKIGYGLYVFLLITNYLLLFYMHIDPPTASDIFSRETKTMRERYEGLGNGE